MTTPHSGIEGCLPADVDWARFTVVLLKPDCLRRGLTQPVLDRIAEHVDIIAIERVTVADWQIFVHYWDLLLNRDCFTVDVINCLRTTYVGRDVVVALGRGDNGRTAARVRALLGHFDPTKAAPATIRRDFGEDSHHRAREEHRLVENLVHTSDDPAAACRDFGVWFGTHRTELLTIPHHTEVHP